jgi:hypothetical protein
MGTAMTNSFIKMSGTLSKETTVAYENARKEMMASAERRRKEMMASAERRRKEMMASAERRRKEMMASAEREKIVFAQIGEARHEIHEVHYYF